MIISLQLIKPKKEKESDFTMKRLLISMIALMFLTGVLVACSDGANDQAEDEEDNVTEETDETENKVVEEEEDVEADNEDSAEDDDSKSTGGRFESSVEDQLDLRIGDTGIADTTIGKFELTVDSAEIVGPELDGVESVLEEIIVLNLTFKNIGDEVIIAEDIMSMMGITDNIDGSNYHNNPEAFESIDTFEGELQPGEERKTQFVAHIYEADEYYFRMDPGNVASGSTNQILWTISAEEAGK